MSCYFNVSPSKTSVIVHCQVQNCRGYLKNLKKYSPPKYIDLP